IAMVCIVIGNKVFFTFNKTLIAHILKSFHNSLSRTNHIIIQVSNPHPIPHSRPILHAHLCCLQINPYQPL
ncbi:hypothetical protein VIGAN_10067500, partial [Vigna angularis var. angularis]